MNYNLMELIKGIVADLEMLRSASERDLFRLTAFYSHHKQRKITVGDY